MGEKVIHLQREFNWIKNGNNSFLIVHKRIIFNVYRLMLEHFYKKICIDTWSDLRPVFTKNSVYSLNFLVSNNSI